MSLQWRVLLCLSAHRESRYSRGIAGQPCSFDLPTLQGKGWPELHDHFGRICRRPPRTGAGGRDGNSQEQARQPAFPAQEVAKPMLDCARQVVGRLTSAAGNLHTEAYVHRALVLHFSNTFHCRSERPMLVCDSEVRHGR